VKTAELLAHAFRAQGVDTVFGIAGDANLEWWAAMHTLGARMIDTRQELGAVAMAEGYSQASGDVGVASVTAGPGLVQSGLAIANAVRAGAAVVVFAGDNPTTTLEAPQLLDQRRFAEACGAQLVAVRAPHAAAEDVVRAFELARGLQTCVVLNAPMDVQAATVDVDADAISRTSPASDRTAAVPDDATVVALIDRISAAQRPVVLAGRGAMRADAGPFLVALAEQIGAATATTLLAKGYLDDDPFCLGVVGPVASAAADDVLATADLVLAFGASLDRFCRFGKPGVPTFPHARVLSVLDPAPAIGIPGVEVLAGDARATAKLLLDRLPSTPRMGGLRNAQVSARLAAEPPRVGAVSDGVIHPAEAMRVLERHLTHDQHRVVVGSGHFFSWPVMHLRRPQGGRFLFAYAFGSIGLGLPIAMGAALGDPSSRVVVVEGDASLMEIVQELETASRHQIPVTVVVMNDEQLGAERFKGELLGLDPALMHIATPRFDEVARAFGGDGARATDAESMGAALQRAAGSPGAFVVDTRIDPTVLCDMYRKLHFDLPNVAPHQREPRAPSRASVPRTG
jgi:thiamine pyrophosphate-dependent acetolactate synthase large subunit-like protein